MGIGEPVAPGVFIDRGDVTITFEDGPCQGHSTSLPPWDVTTRIYAAVVEGPWVTGWVHVLGDSRTLSNDYVMRVAHPRWEFVGGKERQTSDGLWREYERVPDSLTYRLVPR